MTRPDHMSEPTEGLQDLLLRELRAAVSARMKGGADPGEMTADLDRRLRSLREMRRGTGRDLGSEV
jgi:hypothetical protein